MNRFVVPVIVFLILVVFLGVGLTLRPSELPSPLVDKPVPEFSLPLLHNPSQSLGSEDMRGQVWALNVWASWCYSCLTEHPHINALATTHAVPVIGLNYKDAPAAAKAWLQRNGDSYQASIIDREGKVGIDFGVYGVPETFIVDKTGIIRFKHIGPVTQASLETKLLPLIRQLEREE